MKRPILRQLLPHVHNPQNPNPAPKNGMALLGVTTVTAIRMLKECSWLSRNQSSTGTMNGNALLFQSREQYRNIWLFILTTGGSVAITGNTGRYHRSKHNYDRVKWVQLVN